MQQFFLSSKAKINQSIREVMLGLPPKSILVGGQSAMPFVNLDGTIPHKPRIAVEIHLSLPHKYPELLAKAWEDVLLSPVNWAKKAQDIGADLIALRTNGIENNCFKAVEIAAIINEIVEKTNLPLIILGINNREIDKLFLPEIARLTKNLNCLIGPVEEETYKDIVPACRDNNHCVIARTPIDVNLAKQLNILITELGMPVDKIFMDPNMGGLGYGLDYAYSVIEKIRLAAFEGDKMLNMPIIVFSGEETWRTKEAKSSIADEIWGNPEIRSTMWEGITTSSMLMAGADIIIMRFPQSIERISRFIKGLDQ